MRRSIESLAEALDEARPNLVLAISDYGAHVGEDVGMPFMFHLFEERLRQLKMDKVFLRSAEHMEGWAPSVPVAIATGVLPSSAPPGRTRNFPPSQHRTSARSLPTSCCNGSAGTGEQIVHVEGPRRYSANDVAAALSQLLGRTVTAQALPRSQWQETLEQGLSASAAKLLVDLYDAHNKGGLIDVEPGTGEVRHGTTELIDALRPFAPATVNDNN